MLQAKKWARRDLTKYDAKTEPSLRCAFSGSSLRSWSDLIDTSDGRCLAGSSLFASSMQHESNLGAPASARLRQI